MTDISCSIVLYHHIPEKVRPAIESFLNCGRNVKLYLIDNSDDDSLRYQFISPQVQYIFTEENIGYAAGHNMAIKMAEGKSRCHLILNPAVEFHSAVLDELYNLMKTHSGADQILLKGLQRNNLHLPGKLWLLSGSFMKRFVPQRLQFLLSRYLLKHQSKNRHHSIVMNPLDLSGGFTFIRTCAIDSTGYFDEHYHTHSEKNNLFLRSDKQYRTIYYPSVYNKEDYPHSFPLWLKLTLYRFHSGIRHFNKRNRVDNKNRIYVSNTINHSN